MPIATHRPRIVAVLGPTNTGKTYLAFERMLGHGSGMMGFPLRLLARENYDRAVKIKGERQVALITGEEKIVPPYAKYFFCTVESMPVDKKVAFLAVDEIQLAADPDRGHVFTERLLYARGEEETMFMGADTIRALLKRLIPEAETISRPRFSTLSYVGAKKIQRLPPRSAIVGFTAQDVYAIAELIRRQRGGAALVMGALSPRTRNAQVALFQSGEVDYLVATDAIGMGLNMDVDHVAFAATEKFDGVFQRPLRPEELAQIAGRAGRHMSDGTFGVTADAAELSPEIVMRIEEHSFDPLRGLYWRNPVLDFASVAALKASLAREPQEVGLKRAGAAADERTFDELMRDPEVAAEAMSRDQVARLWQVAQIPDFGRTSPERHARLLAQIYRLMGAHGRLPTDWFAAQVATLDNVDGAIDALLQRIANIRIWTFVSHRADWIDDHAHWQARTREVEDRLSDALHRALTQRFVDARTTQLMKRLQERERLTATVADDGAVLVEGHHVGRLVGLKFAADRADTELAGRAVSTAAFRALGSELARRAAQMIEAPDDSLVLGADATLSWNGAAVARLVPGATPLKPNVVLIGGEVLDSATHDRLEARLVRRVGREIAAVLGPLVRAADAELTGSPRGLVYQLVENLGTVPRETVAPLVARFHKADFSALRRLGIWVGRRDVYFPDLLRPKPAALAALLWAVHQGLRPVPEVPPAGRTSIALDPALPDGFLRAAGYRAAGPRAARMDIVERLAVAVKGGTAPTDPSLANLLGSSQADAEAVVKALAPAERRRHRRGRPSVAPDSPFAKLKDLAIG
jgi:ATP-dependent RNA helicase SUPV3L1/SUV3